MGGACRSGQCLCEILAQVVEIFQPDAEAHGGVAHIHCGTCFGVEKSEDGARRVDGQRAIVEKIGGAVHQAQGVEETERGVAIGKSRVSIAPNVPPYCRAKRAWAGCEGKPA